MPDIHLPYINQVIELFSSLYNSYGYLIVFLAALIGNTMFIGSVFPGGTMAALGGFYAHQGTLAIGWVIFFVWMGMVAGYNLDYLIGRYLLAHFAQQWSKTRLGQRLQLAERLEQGTVFLERHGGLAIFIAYATLGHMRSFVAVSVGITRMSYWRFLVLQMSAGLIWSAFYVLLGYFLGTQANHIGAVFQQFGLAAFCVLALLYITWSIWKAHHWGRADPVFGHLFVASSPQSSHARQPRITQDAPENMAARTEALVPVPTPAMKSHDAENASAP